MPAATLLGDLRRRCSRRIAHRPWNRAAALLQEGRDPLAGVLGAEGGDERLLLRLEPGLDVTGGGNALDLLDGHRSLAGELARPGERGVEQLVVRDDAVHEPERVGLAGVDRVADEVELERPRLADQSRESLRPSEPGDDPEADLGLPEARRLGGEPHVARHRELVASAEGDGR